MGITIITKIIIKWPVTIRDRDNINFNWKGTKRHIEKNRTDRTENIDFYEIATVSTKSKSYENVCGMCASKKFYIYKFKFLHMCSIKQKHQTYSNWLILRT